MRKDCSWSLQIFWSWKTKSFERKCIKKVKTVLLEWKAVVGWWPFYSAALKWLVNNKSVFKNSGKQAFLKKTYFTMHCRRLRWLQKGIKSKNIWWSQYILSYSRSHLLYINAMICNWFPLNKSGHIIVTAVLGSM